MFVFWGVYAAHVLVIWGMGDCTCEVIPVFTQEWIYVTWFICSINLLQSNSSVILTNQYIWCNIFVGYAWDGWHYIYQFIWLRSNLPILWTYWGETDASIILGYAALNNINMGRGVSWRVCLRPFRPKVVHKCPSGYLSICISCGI